MTEKKSNLFARLIAWLFSPAFKALLKKTLEREFIKMILAKLIISGGIKGWLITLLADKIIDEADEHLLEPLFRKINYIGDHSNGKTVYKKIENSPNRDTWRDNISRS